MKISQNENELIVQEKPGSLWIFGLFFAVIGGVFVYGSLGGFTNHSTVPLYAIVLSFLMGSVGVATGIWIIYRAPLTKVFINRRTKTVTLVRYGLAGKQENIYSFGEIKQFCLVEEMDDENSPIWSLGLELSGGETIVISSLQSHDEKYKRDFVFQTNEFLQKQMPSYKPVSEIEDESRRETD